MTAGQRRDYGPVQLATYLGLEPWQFSRARAAALIPAPDRARGRWSAAAATGMWVRVGEIVSGAGMIPDLGAVRAAEALSARLGVIVTPAGVVELSRCGQMPEAGSFKGCPLYDGRAIEAFGDPGLAEEATRAGQLRTADGAASYLKVRRADFDHLTRLGLLSPADWAHGPYDARVQRPAVPHR